MLQDTIAAISTPIGEAGLGVVRLSGADSLKIAEACFKPVGENSAKPSEAKTHTVHYGRMHRSGNPASSQSAPS
jgi:tRNA modification GTPase